MKVIQEVICSKCGKKQITAVAELLRDNLFWRTCEFCGRYGLTVMTKRKLTLREWMEALYNTMGLRVLEIETFLKKQ